MSEGRVYKRCTHEGAAKYTGGDTDVRACRESHGSWYFDAEAPRTEEGRRRRHVVGGHPTKEDAEEALTAYLGRRNAGQWRDDKAMTVAEALEKWLEAGDWELLTRATYEGHLDTVWRKRIGHHRLRNLRKHHIEEVLTASKVDANGKPRAARTLQSYRATIRAFLAWCIEEGLRSDNPAAGRLRSLPSASKPELQIWQPQEVALFLAVTVNDSLSSMWRLMAFTGLRRAEVCGIRWTDVDLEGEHPGVTIRQTVPALAGEHPCVVCGGKHRGGFIKPSPKSDAGQRWVPLVPEALAALQDQAHRQEAERAAWRHGYADHALCFAREDGTPLNPSSVTQRFKYAVKAARHPANPSYRLTVIRPHDMRHGAASLMIAAGVPIETVSLILGHSSPAITRSIYTHVLRGPAMAALEAAAELVRSSASGAQNVHNPLPSSEREGVMHQLTSRSERSSSDADPDRHCMTNSVKYTS